MNSFERDDMGDECQLDNDDAFDRSSYRDPPSFHDDGALHDGETVYQVAYASDGADAVAGATDDEIRADCGEPTDGGKMDETAAVRFFCTRWCRLKEQLDTLASVARGVRSEQADIKRVLGSFMGEAQARRAFIERSDGAVIAVRVDPTRPTTSMRREVITAAVYQHLTPRLLGTCADAVAERAEKQSAKRAKAAAVAARKAARAAAAAARPVKRRRRKASNDEDNDGSDESKDRAVCGIDLDHNARATKGQTGTEAASDDRDDASHGPTLAEILGEAIVEATRVAQREMNADKTTLTVGIYDPDRDDESSVPLCDDDGGCPQSHCRAVADTGLGECDVEDKNAAQDGQSHDDKVWSAPSVPVEVRAKATRFIELADVAADLRDRMRPLETALEALTLDLPATTTPPPSSSSSFPGGAPAKSARTAPSARALEAAAKRARHEAFAPVRDAVARYLNNAGADKRGVPVQFPTSSALYRLRESTRTRTGTVTRTDYGPVATSAVAAAIAQIEIDPATAYWPDAAADLLDDDEFRNRLFEAVVDGIDQHRQRGTIRTRAISLVRVSATGSASAEAPTEDA